jgi:hypothetical protein
LLEVFLIATRTIDGEGFENRRVVQGKEKYKSGVRQRKKAVLVFGLGARQYHVNQKHAAD